MGVASGASKIVTTQDNFLIPVGPKPKPMWLPCEEDFTGTLNGALCHFAAAVWTLHIFHSFAKFSFTSIFIIHQPLPAVQQLFDGQGNLLVEIAAGM